MQDGLIDPKLYSWLRGEALLSYFLTLGWKILKVFKPKVNIIEKKGGLTCCFQTSIWHGSIHATSEDL